MTKYIAIDIGASSGRALVADFSEELIIDEINRFTIEIIKSEDERLNLEKLEGDIKESLRLAFDKYDDIRSIGIDTWAVDTVAIDQSGNPVDNPMFYRDKSFVKSFKDYSEKSDLYELYQKTGIQIQAFNTFFQMRVASSNYKMEEVENFLMLPDYLSFRLSGEKSMEFTNATTTQSINLETNEFSCEHQEKFMPISSNRLLGKLKSEFGPAIDVISVASHDTASAILAIPHLNASDAFLSSGTWSLLGKHVERPIRNEKAFEYNYSNEGNFDGSYRFQKNIMGLWLIVSFAKENGLTDFVELNRLAAESENDAIIDINDSSFLNPKSMTEAIIDYCQAKNLKLPETVGDYARVIYRSLAHSYKEAIEELEEASGEKIESLTIVGGGAKARFLNQEINKILKQKVKLFPYECSALGNVIVQAIETGQFASLTEAHHYVAQHLKIYTEGEKE